MLITSQTAVGEIAVEIPGAAQVLARHRIDYCSQGGVTLAHACTRADVPVEAVLLDLDDARRGLPGDRADARWREAPLGQLVHEIVRVHHGYARTEFERLGRLAEAARSREGASRPELHRVAELLAALAEELEPHMVREEREVFPLMLALERAAEGQGPVPHLSSAELEKALEHEHLSQVEVLQELRRLTFGYQAPDDASLPLRMLYQGLEQLEVDLVRHVHLENNVLFPRAQGLARRCKAK